MVPGRGGGLPSARKALFRDHDFESLPAPSLACLLVPITPPPIRLGRPSQMASFACCCFSARGGPLRRWPTQMGNEVRVRRPPGGPPDGGPLRWKMKCVPRARQVAQSDGGPLRWKMGGVSSARQVAQSDGVAHSDGRPSLMGGGFTTSTRRR